MVAGGTAIVDAGGTISYTKVKDGGTVTNRGNSNVVNGAGTVATGLTATTGFVATLNAALGGTADASPNSVGGSVLGGTAIVFSIKDHAGGTVAGTVSVGWTAWGTA